MGTRSFFGSLHPMRSKVFIACSLDGFIAREDGSLDWLMDFQEQAPEGEDFGYGEFMQGVDCLVMGRATFEFVASLPEWPYAGRRVVVMSRRGVEHPEVESTFEPPRDLAKRLAREGVQGVYVDGGLTIQSWLSEGLIDEMTISWIPVLLGSGRPLFGPVVPPGAWSLESVAALPLSLVRTKYVPV